MSQPHADSHLDGPQLVEPQKFFVHNLSDDVDGEPAWSEGELVTEPVETAEGSFAYAKIGGVLARINMANFEVQQVVANLAVAD